MIGAAAYVGYIAISAAIHFAAGGNIPLIAPAAQGVETVISYGKAA